jgi:glycogen operon protein
MYCGKNGEENEYIYIAYNMHWDTHRFALPSIGNCEWTAVIGTDNNEVVIDDEVKADYIDIKPRSISILVGKKTELKPAEKKPSSKNSSDRKASDKKTSEKKGSTKKETVKSENIKKDTTVKKRKYVRKKGN